MLAFLPFSITSPKELTTINQIKTNKGKKTDTYGEHTIVSPFAPESEKPNIQRKNQMGRNRNSLIFSGSDA